MIIPRNVKINRIKFQRFTEPCEKVSKLIGNVT